MKRLVMAILCMALSLSVCAIETKIDRDGMLLADGGRRFVIGLYEEAKDNAFAKEAADAGFNLIRVNPTLEALNRAKENNLMAWIPLGGLVVGNDTQAVTLQDLVHQWKDHTALAIWEAPDEALWNLWWRPYNRDIKRRNKVEEAIRAFEGKDKDKEILIGLAKEWRRYRGSARYKQAEKVEEEIRKMVGLPEAKERLSEWSNRIDVLYGQLKRGCDIIRKADRSRVIWFNHAPRNTMADLMKYGTLADVVGCDIYPVPFGPEVGHSDIAERNLASVGRYTERMAASVPGKPVWMVLQGFGWDDLSEDNSINDRSAPTYNQSRFMAYDAIVNGARGILYWGTFCMNKESTFWMELKQLTGELHSIEPFLSAPDANEQVKLTQHHTAFSDEKGIRWLAKEHNGKWAIVLVNESDSPLAFDIEGLDELEGKTFQVLNGDEQLVVKNGTMTYGLPSRKAEVLIQE
jgi:hypothetical protein